MHSSVNFRHSMKNRVTQSVRLFVHKKRNAYCRAFLEVSSFFYIKRHITQSFMLFIDIKMKT